MAELWFARRLFVSVAAFMAAVMMIEHNIETGDWFGVIAFTLMASWSAISLWFEPRK